MAGLMIQSRTYISLIQCWRYVYVPNIQQTIHISAERKQVIRISMQISYGKAILICVWMLIYNNVLIGILLRNSKSALSDTEVLSGAMGFCKERTGDGGIQSEACALAMVELAALRTTYKKLETECEQGKKDKEDLERAKIKVDLALTQCEQERDILRSSKGTVLTSDMEAIIRERDKARNDAVQANKALDEIMLSLDSFSKGADQAKAVLALSLKERLLAQRELDKLRQDLKLAREELAAVSIAGDESAESKARLLRAIQDRDTEKTRADAADKKVNKLLADLDAISRAASITKAEMARMSKERERALAEAEDAHTRLTKVLKDVEANKERCADPAKVDSVALIKAREQEHVSAATVDSRLQDILLDLERAAANREHEAIAKAEADRSKAWKEAEKCKKDLQMLILDVESMGKDSRDAEGEAKKVAAKALKDKEQVENELEKLKERYERLRNSTKELERTATADKGELVRIMREREIAQEEADRLRKARGQVMDVVEQIAKGDDPAKIRIAALVKENDEARKMIFKLTQSLDKLKSELETLISAKSNDVARPVIHKIIKEREDAQVDVDALKKRVEELKAEMDLMSRGADPIKAEMAKVINEREELENLMSKMGKKMDQMASEIDALGKGKNEAVTEAAKAIKERGQIRTELERAEKRLADATAELQKILLSADSAKAETAELAREKDQLVRIVHKLKDRLMRVMAEIEAITSGSEPAKAEAATAIKARAKAEGEATRLQVRSEELRTGLDLVEKGEDPDKSKLAMMVKLRDDAMEEVHRLEEELEEARRGCPKSCTDKKCEEERESLKTELVVSNEKANNAVGEYNKCKDMLDDLEKTNKELTDENGQLKESEAETRGKLESVPERLSTIPIKDSVLALLPKDKTEFTFGALAKNMGNIIGLLTDSLKKTQDALNNCDDVKKGLQKQVEVLEAGTSKTGKDYADQAAAYAQCQAEVTRLNAGMEDAKKTVVNLQVKNDELHKNYTAVERAAAELEGTKTKLTAAEEENAELKKKVDEAGVREAALVEQQRQVNERAKELATDRDKVLDEREDCTVALASAGKERDDCRQELWDERNKTANIMSSFSSAELDLKKIRVLLETCTKDVSTCKDELNRTKVTAAEQQAQLSAAQEALHKCENGMQVLGVLSNKLKNKLLAETETARIDLSIYEELKANCTKLEGELRDKEDRIVGLEEDADLIKAELQNVTEAKQQLESQATNVATEKETWVAKEEALTTNLTNTWIMYEKCEQKQTDTTFTIGTMMGANDVLEQAVSQLNKNIYVISVRNQDVALDPHYALTEKKLLEFSDMVKKFLDAYTARTVSTPSWSIQIGYTKGEDPKKDFEVEFFHRDTKKRYTCTFFKEERKLVFAETLETGRPHGLGLVSPLGGESECVKNYQAFIHSI